MKQVKWALVATVVGAILGTFPLVTIAAPLADCSPPFNLQTYEMGMSPDPVPQGQPIRRWTAKVVSGYATECLAVLEIIELLDQDQNSLMAGKNVPSRIAAKVQYRITPSPVMQNVGPLPISYAFAPDLSYGSFKGEHYCFMVAVDVQGIPRPISAKRSFCPRLGPGGWSLK